MVIVARLRPASRLIHYVAGATSIVLVVHCFHACDSRIVTPSDQTNIIENQHHSWAARTDTRPSWLPNMPPIYVKCINVDFVIKFAATKRLIKIATLHCTEQGGIFAAFCSSVSNLLVCGLWCSWH